MTESRPAAAAPGRTAWARNLQTPLRRFLRTQTGSAAVLLGATIAALVWANLGPASYQAVWGAQLSVHLDGASLSQDLRGWVNSGLMTFFFFVVGLEARREFDMGELRERRRLAMPLLAGLGGMIVPVAIFLAVNAGQPSAHGWGTAMSTDTAFALGLLALVGPRAPDRMRTFLLTFAVVDDLTALAIIAIFYSHDIRLPALLAGLGTFAVVLGVRAAGVRRGLVYAGLGLVAWGAFMRSGVDPVVVGLVMGLLTQAYPAARGDLERASDRFRRFREQPTPGLAREASIELSASISPNERLQEVYHPWTSYLIVPLFALANAGVAINGPFLARAFTSPITLGILTAYVVGKPVGVAGMSWLVTVVSKGRLRPPAGWAAVTGAGTIAGIGFTVSLLIASLAFTGPQLAEAKAGVLAAALCAALLTWAVFQLTALLPTRARLRAMLGTSAVILDLAVPVDPRRDHIRGPHTSLVTVVEYGDFECPFCGRAEPAVRELLADYGDVRYVWRHLPLSDVHPHAQLAAEAAEAAAGQGAFWEMHDVLFGHQGALKPADLIRYAGQLGLDVPRFTADLRKHAGAGRVAEDVDSADLSGVSGTPTFFINGQRHHGAYDIEVLSTAVRAAKARAAIARQPAR
ncbi:MAG TPA: Na+/H+ antiporter NhaA [Streptosporangiaceae bacterium]|nr:Na+/H+ antiporter NhaA [Streptosporangiaceae bacterium]